MSRQDTLWKSDHFGFTRTALTVTGEPTLKEWAEAGTALTRVRSGVNWGIGDWLCYAEGKQWNQDRVEHILSSLNLKRGTLYNLKSVAKAFPPALRRPDVPWSHHAAVASLDSDDALKLLERAARQKWGFDEISAHARSSRELRKRALQAFPVGTYGLIYAAPPWRGDVLDPNAHSMTADDLSAMAPQVQSIMAPNCVSYVWASNTRLEEAFAVLRAWGLSYKTNMVKVKDLMGDGVWTRPRHDLLLVATRGLPAAPDSNLVPDSVIGLGEDVYDILDTRYPEVPKVELFATQPRAGWTAWGLETTPEPVRAIHIEHEVVQA